MAERRERTVEELYNATESIAEAEACKIQNEGFLVFSNCNCLN